MKAETKKITIKELTDGTYSVCENGDLIDYEDAQNKTEFGATAWGGKLNVRPSYQRNFVWDELKQVKLIESILRGWVINPLVFAKVGDTYECVDGQQRTLSICNYRYNELHVDGCYFGNESIKRQNDFLNYELDVRVIEYDNDREKIEHFTAINQPITVLTKQELRNATYNGPFVEDLKKWFGRANCRMKKNGYAEKYIKLTSKNGDMIERQELVELALLWNLVITNDELYEKLTSGSNKDHLMKIDGEDADYLDNLIQSYMAKHKNDANCDEVVNNFKAVVEWIMDTFDNFTNSQMQNVKNWAYLYRKYRNVKFDKAYITMRLKTLMADPEIHHKHSIPEYLFITNSNPNMNAEEISAYAHKMLSLNSFPDYIKTAKYAEQDGKCADCGEPFQIEYLEAHHIVPWSLGGKSVPENCVMLCKCCHGRRHNFNR